MKHLLFLGIGLALLVGPFAVARLAGVPPVKAGRISIAVIFLLAALAHFVKSTEIAALIPPVISLPVRQGLVIATGGIELAFAVLLVLPLCPRLTGLAVVAYLLAVTPFNVYGAMEKVPLGGHDLPGYLWVRLPLQALLIGWTWWFAVRSRARS